MLNYENVFLMSYGKVDEKKLYEKAKKLNRYYKKCCDRLEKNYMHIERVYGRKLTLLVEHDTEISNIDFILHEMMLKLDSLISQTSDLRNNLDFSSETISNHIYDTKQWRDVISERIDDIEFEVQEINSHE